MIVLNQIISKLYSQYSSDNINILCHIVFGGMEKNIFSDLIINNALENVISTLKDGGYTNARIVITDCEGLINSKNKEIIDIIEYQKTFNYITDTDPGNKLNGYISIINGSEIAELVRKHQSAIFEANIRDFIKK
ncbi:MAG: hypothetical protein IPG79_16725 [Saprospiraceae bacterium]|nr:hypothetical protein [Saprospiraceae bacterium]